VIVSFAKRSRNPIRTFSRGTTETTKSTNAYDSRVFSVATSRAITLAAVAIGALTCARAVGIPAWFEPTEPLRIVGPIHYVGTRGLGVYLITTPAGHILLNGAMPSSAKRIEKSIRKLGYDPADIRLLLVSHAHIDHVGTLAYFKKRTGARVAVLTSEKELLESGGKTDYLYSNRPAFHFEPVHVDRELRDGDTVSLGGVTLRARWTPGHTRGTTTWTATVAEGGRGYEVVFLDGTGVNPGTRLVVDPSYRGIADDYRRTFGVLESLKPDVFLAYHAEFFDFDGKRARAAAEGAAAFVDPEGYRRGVAEAKAEFLRKLERETAR
jgi:metallo-beta-lactamase class B